MGSEYAGLINATLPKGLPDDAVAFCATNAAAVTTAGTPVTVYSAVAGKRHFITQAIAVNPTTAEAAILIIEDGSTNEYAHIPAVNAKDDTSKGTCIVNFDPPLVIPVGEAIKVDCVGNIGDSFLTVNGYEGT